ncbi:MAG: bifunctional 5,10-methylenetetrahydrofolate dehydrogenase/5,10-methenyltetrahydrofolate cyclohydrolase [Candidatus Gastranaerophilales bacterium]|nr:bifunctional 5,10-methylenetetrahydrofolate dehydrogenase/5,10-methenyltetrahydrofolate cyclohydrolase [Candidatus Gastranaerophilales bacterium]
MTVILDGKSLANKITEELKNKTQSLTNKPKLAVLLVGDNPASQIYVKNKQKKAEYIGFESLVIPLPKEATEDNILEHIYILNEDTNINAILVQLPLPDGINQKRIIEAIDPIKDVDGFTSYNFGRLALGYKPYTYPCTPKGIIKLLEEYNIELSGKNVLVIGRSNIVGKPVSLMLQQKNATVTMANSYTQNLREISKQADIIISAVGKPKFITQDYIKDDAIIVDVGINRTDNGLCGDIDFENAKEHTSHITPVPGGVGPMTIAMLMENTLELYNLQKELLL